MKKTKNGKLSAKAPDEGAEPLHLWVLCWAGHPVCRATGPVAVPATLRVELDGAGLDSLMGILPSIGTAVGMSPQATWEAWWSGVSGTISEITHQAHGLVVPARIDCITPASRAEVVEVEELQ